MRNFGMGLGDDLLPISLLAAVEVETVGKYGNIL